MSSPDKRSIVVRVEVEIPGDLLRTPPPDPGRIQIELTKVGPPSGVANVKDTGGGFGSICAKGNSKDDDNKPAVAVYAKVYPDGTTTFPGTPPGGADGATGTVPDANGDWVFSGNLDIPKAAHNAGGTAKNILYIWATYDGGKTYETKQTSFTGKTSTGTDCIPGPGSGSGSTGSSGSSSKSPREWRVIGEGFGGAAGAFNVASLLRIQVDASGHHVWTNGGNRTTSPSIELRHLAHAGVWELAFRYLVFEIRYTCPSSSWHPLNANTLHLDGPRKGSDEAPHSLTINPV